MHNDCPVIQIDEQVDPLSKCEKQGTLKLQFAECENSAL